MNAPAVSRVRLRRRSLASGAAILAAVAAGCRGQTQSRPPSPAPVAHPASTSATTVAHFTDVTSGAGIHFRYERCATKNKYLIETMGPGCAFLDYDNDGWLDILLLQGAPLPGSSCKQPLTLKLYHNNHDGTFTDVTKRAGLDVSFYSMGVAVGDYDNDGYQDLYITAVLGPSHLFHNNRNGTFTDVTASAGVSNRGMWGTSAAWLDYDHDGYLDLFVCNYVRYRSLADDMPCYYRPGVRSYCIPRAYAGSSCHLYHNNHDGTFTDVTKKSGIFSNAAKALAVTVCDLNDDGWPDIVVANDTVANFCYVNDGHGHFKDEGVMNGLALGPGGGTKAGMGLAAADDQNNGTLAITVSNFFGEAMAFYRRDSHGLFSDVGDQAGIMGPSMNRLAFGVRFLDYDNDGYQDLLYACGHVQEDASQFQSGAAYKEPVLLFHNLQHGVYKEISSASGPPLTTPLVGRGLAVGDFNNDGREDVLIGSNDGRVMLWRNDTPTANHWLTLKLRGTHCNRDGIGARVIVRAGGMTQTHWLTSGGSYLSESDHRVHFGLGSASSAEVEIRWPDNRRQIIHGVSADQILPVTET